MGMISEKNSALTALAEMAHLWCAIVGRLSMGSVSRSATALRARTASRSVRLPRKLGALAKYARRLRRCPLTVKRTARTMAALRTPRTCS